MGSKGGGSGLEWASSGGPASDCSAGRQSERAIVCTLGHNLAMVPRPRGSGIEADASQF